MSDNYSLRSDYPDDAILRIKYPNGKMTIDMLTFFPSEAGRLRKLLKVIGLIYDYREQERLLKQIHAHLILRYDPADWDNRLRIHANAVVDNRTKEKETQSEIEKQEEVVRKMDRHLKSLPTRAKERAALKQRLKGEKQRLKDLKEKRKHYKSDASWHNGEFIKMQAAGRKYAKDLEILRGIDSATWQLCLQAQSAEGRNREP